MIIKSMSRKAPTFGQLADYIARGSNAQTGTAFVRNIYADGQDREAVVGQFLDNYRYLPERKNGNALYHEIIALEPQAHLPPEQINDALHELAEQYCLRRAPRQLAWGRVHLPSSSEAVGQEKSTNFPNIHLVISANEVRSDRRVRMDRKYFAKVQRDLERFQRRELPHLVGQDIYDRDGPSARPKQPSQEGEMVRRTQKPSCKQAVHEVVKDLIETASDRVALAKMLETSGFRIYRRGRSIDVIDQEGLRYRLQTLGLAEAYFALPENAPKRTEVEQDPRVKDLLQRDLGDRFEEKLRGFDPER